MALTDQLTAFTRKNYIPVLQDNIYKSNPLFVRLKNRFEFLDGGIQISQPVLYAKDTSNIVRYTGAEVLTVNPSENSTEAVFNWANYAAGMQMLGVEDAKNSGKTVVVNLLKMKVQQAEKSLKDVLGDDIHDDNATNGVVGIMGAVDDGTNTATYGNINRSTYTWWKANYSANGGTGRAVTRYLLRNMAGLCTIDNDRPNIYVTTQGVLDKMSLMLDSQKYLTDPKLGEAGFMNLVWEGRPVVVDSHIQSPNSNHQLYMLNDNYFHFYVHKDRNFKMRPFMPSVNQDVITAYIYLMACLTCSAPRMSGRIIDLDPTL